MNRNDPTTRSMLRAVRRNFEQATGIRTYPIAAIREETAEDLFTADKPWNSSMETRLLEWLQKAEQEGGRPLDFSIRNTRMTIRFATGQEA